MVTLFRVQFVVRVSFSSVLLGWGGGGGGYQPQFGVGYVECVVDSWFSSLTWPESD